MNKRLSFVNFMNFDIRIMIDFDYIRHFFLSIVRYLLFILKLNFDRLKTLKMSKFNLLFMILLILIAMLIINALF